MDIHSSFPNANLESKDIEKIVQEAKDYAYSKGLVLRSVDEPDSQEVVTHAPFTLFPSPVPTDGFKNAIEIQINFNLLMHRVAHDYNFMKMCLQSVIKVDEFTRNLWNIYATVKEEGVNQPISLAMNRSDYMFHTGTNNTAKPELKQIEFNTMSSSFAGLSVQLQHLHKFTSAKAGKFENIKNIPENKSLEGLAKAVITAWEAYKNPKAVIIFLVLPTERNIYDQRFLQYAINQINPSVRIIRKTLKDFRNRGQLSSNKCLFIDGEEVAIVYQRCCYVPDHFENSKDWDARLLIERSKAIKCPSVNYHLAGTKKIQQVLAKPGVMEKYLQDKQVIESIRQTFAGQYSLDLDDEGDANAKLGMENPDLFVLKPQREGGGNNMFGDEMRQKLIEMGKTEERTAYILMERIHPMQHRNYPIRSGKHVEQLEMVSELGIFGTLVGRGNEIILNEECGYILRSKSLGTNEGGVATGFAVLDSPILC